MSEYMICMIIVCVLGIIAVYAGLYFLMNTYDAIVSFKKPEYFCPKCGKRVFRKNKKCPKCKVKLEFKKEEIKVNVEKEDAVEVAAKIRKLKEMKEEGLITEEELETKKQNLLKKL